MAMPDGEEALELRLELLKNQQVLYDIRDLLAFQSAITNIQGHIPTNDALRAMRTLLQALHAEQNGNVGPSESEDATGLKAIDGVSVTMTEWVQMGYVIVRCVAALGLADQAFAQANAHPDEGREFILSGFAYVRQARKALGQIVEDWSLDSRIETLDNLSWTDPSEPIIYWRRNGE